VDATSFVFRFLVDVNVAVVMVFSMMKLPPNVYPVRNIHPPTEVNFTFLNANTIA
jgi:hypothetical protein